MMSRVKCECRSKNFLKRGGPISIPKVSKLRNSIKSKTKFGRLGDLTGSRCITSLSSIPAIRLSAPTQWRPRIKIDKTYKTRSYES